MFQALHVTCFPIPEQPHDIRVIFIFQIRKLRLSQVMEFSTISIAGMELNPFLALKPMLYPLLWADTCDMAMSNNCCCLVSKSCLTYNPLDCSPLGPSVCGISQASILEWVAISFSRGSSWPGGQTQVFCIGGWIPYHGAPGKPMSNTYWVANTGLWQLTHKIDFLSEASIPKCKGNPFLTNGNTWNEHNIV